MGEVARFRSSQIHALNDMDGPFVWCCTAPYKTKAYHLFWTFSFDQKITSEQTDD